MNFIDLEMNNIILQLQTNGESKTDTLSARCDIFNYQKINHIITLHADKLEIIFSK